MKLLITENQYKKLFEARKEGFRLDYLTSAKSHKEMLRYCNEMLGKPIGRGSSRIVYQLDDETCLKLAFNKKGVAQNLEEISIESDGFTQFIPKIYNGSDEENGLWVITQYVLPAKESDFKKVLNIDFNDISKFAYCVNGKGDRLMNWTYKVVDKLYQKYENNEEVLELFNDIENLKANYNQLVGDLSRIQNWGMVRENDKTFMVMLDTGFSEEVYNQFYKRR